MPRLTWVILDVPPQPHYKIVDGSSVGVFVQTPYFLENLFARNNLPVIADQMSQEFRLHQREMNRVAARTQFETAEVDGLAGKRKCSEIIDSPRIGVFFGSRRGRPSASPLAATQ